MTTASHHVTKGYYNLPLCPYEMNGAPFPVLSCFTLMKGLAIWHDVPNIRHIKVNNGR